MSATTTQLTPILFTRLSEARADWQHLTGSPCSNPYQTFDWLEAWCESFAEQLNLTPVIAVGSTGGTPCVVLPLALERSAGTTTLSFLGHQHGNQNTGLWDSAFYQSATSTQMGAFLKAVCAQTGADLLKLQNVPEMWQGRRHPLVLEGALASPSPVFARPLGSDFDQLFRDTHSKSARKNLLRKERHLQAAGGFRAVKADTPSDIRRGLDAFLAQRTRRAAEAGIPNAFGDPAARAFLARVLGLSETDSGTSTRVMDLWYLETAGAIRSTYLCVAHAGTLHAYSNSIAHDDMLPNSPGLVLIKDIIARACAATDLEVLDLGLGEERYKTGWAEPVPLKDSLRAITLKGRVRLKIESSCLRIRTAVRNSALLWPLVRRLRKWKAGLSTPRHG